MALGGIFNRLRPLIERLDALSLRERVIVFGAGVALLYVVWQTVLMDPADGARESRRTAPGRRASPDDA